MGTLRLLALAAALGVLFLTPCGAAESTATVLFRFGSGPDGENPGGVVAGPNGMLYGVTAYGGYGGYPGYGTVFELRPPAEAGGTWTQTVIHRFTGPNGDGLVYFPTVGPVVGANGVIYGTTGAGGASDSGTVFALQPPAAPGQPWTETTLYSFPGAEQGYPAALIIGADGALYGATSAGGVYGQGKVFKLTPPSPGGAPPDGTWTETDLYSFTGASDGSGPEALVINGHGAIYGTTYSGGDYGVGTAFELQPPAVPGRAWTETVRYSFTGAADGSNPGQSSLVLSDGHLYGTTTLGGASGYGTVFQLLPPSAPGGTWTETVLNSFGARAAGPDSPLIVRGGNIYGTTSLLYTGDPILGSPGAGGTVFELQKPASAGAPWTEIVLHYFFNNDIPYGSLFMDKNGSIYGSALDSSGIPYTGFVYEITP